MRKKVGFARTKFVGVFYLLPIGPVPKSERALYVQYYRDGKRIMNKVGIEGHLHVGEDGVKRKLTPAVANQIRSDRIRGREPSNRERREAAREAKDRYTIGKLVDEYLGHRDRQKAVRGDRNLYKRYLEGTFKNKTPEEVDPLSLDRFRKTLSKRKSSRGEDGETLSLTTVRNAMALLRQVVNYGVERKLTTGFSVKVPVPAPAPTLAEEDLSPAQLSALLAALDSEKDRDAADVVRLALFTGARREEILRLRWSDADLDRGSWMLRDRKAGGDAGFPLSASAVAVLKRRSDSRDPADVSEYVFPGTGEHGYLRDPRAAFDRIKTAAKLPEGFRLLHGCRHHYATMLVAAGVDFLTVARLLGHRDAQMVMRKYAHVRNDVLAAAANLSGRLIEETAARGKATNE